MQTNRQVFGRLAFGLAIYMTSIGAAQAASITLSAINSPVMAGTQAEFQLWMDFTGEPTLGGGVDVVFDNFTDGVQLSFASYTPEALGDSFFYSNVPALNAAGDRLEGILFGDFTNGLEGPALVGTLIFNANVAGTYNLSLADNFLAGGFFSYPFGTDQFPNYTSATLTVDAAPAAVPAPATGWLLLSGLAGWAGLSFKPKAKQA